MKRLSADEFTMRKKINSMDKAHRKNDKVGKCTYINFREPETDLDYASVAILMSVLSLKHKKGAFK